MFNIISKRFVIVSLVVSLMLGILAKLWLFPTSDQNASNTSISMVQNDEIFLENNEGTLVNIFNNQGRRIRLVYFGFTHCPDVCPTSLSMMAAALTQIPQSRLEQIRPIFITLDPKRDSGSQAQEYAHYFNPNIEGFSGDIRDITKLAKSYQVTFQETKLENSALDYTIDHSSFFYFISPSGELIEKVPHTLSPEPITNTIMKLTKDITS